MRFPQALRSANHCSAWETEHKVKPRSAKEFELFAKLQLYQDVTDVEMAIVASEVGMNQEDFEKYQDLYRNVKEFESCPDIRLSSGNYVFHKLDADDRRGAALGKIVDCCQHINGAARSCAVAGVESGYSAFYVVEYKGNIVAQSWAWRGKRGELVFDNVEALSGYDVTVISGLYKRASEALLGKLGVTRVTLGDTYYGITKSVIDTLGLKSTKPAKMIHQVAYTGDSAYQVLVAKLPKKKRVKPVVLAPIFLGDVEACVIQVTAVNELLPGSDVFCEYCDAEVHPDAEICPSCGRDIAEWV
jgi:hypothetical protein